MPEGCTTPATDRAPDAGGGARKATPVGGKPAAGIVRMADIRIVDTLEGLRGVDTLEGRIGPIISGERGSAHYITMPAGMYCAPHTHPTESIIFTVEGGWVLCSEGRRHVMRAGSTYFMPAHVETGYEVPFQAPATLLIVKSEGTMDADEFLRYLEGLRERLLERHRAGEPFLLEELPAGHEARVYAESLGWTPA